jgi:hypothetical protein
MESKSFLALSHLCTALATFCRKNDTLGRKLKMHFCPFSLTFCGRRARAFQKKFFAKPAD